MSPSTRLRAIPALLVLSAVRSVSAAPPADANAQPSSTAEAACEADATECGRRAFADGVAAYQAKDFEAARRHFEAALSHRWHPAIALNLALAQVELGALRAALTTLDAIVSSDESSPELVLKATEERDRASSDLAYVELFGTEQNDAVTIDGENIAPVSRAEFPIDPGTHRLVVQRASRAPIERQLSVRRGERLRVDIAPTREVVLSIPTPRAATPREAPQATEPTSDGLAPVWFYAGTGLSVVLAGVTVWSGLDTVAAHDAYERDLPTLDQRGADRRVADGHSLERRTNILLGATIVSTLGAAVLGGLYTDWGKPTASVATSPEGAALHVTGRF